MNGFECYKTRYQLLNVLYSSFKVISKFFNMTNLTLETLPAAVQEMAQQIDEIKTILSVKQPPQDTSKRKYKLPEAAKYCGMAVPTFRTYIDRRKVAGTKFGKAWLFLESDLDKFIQDYRRPTEKELKQEAFENLTNKKR